jgi:hypothetical protein
MLCSEVRFSDLLPAANQRSRQCIYSGILAVFHTVKSSLATNSLQERKLSSVIAAERSEAATLSFKYILYFIPL